MNLNAEEHAVVASLVAGLSGKRERADSPDAAGGEMKRNRVEEPIPTAIEDPPVAVVNLEEQRQPDEELKPLPFFYYKDYSLQPDPDTLTPLTAPGRVPNFVHKLHAILARADLAGTITWLPHGRSWKVLKPRDFEARVIGTYFEHAKFSSFIRQANGWGFRRITTGRDRNSYYHPLFLRGLPHLCKEMKRPGVAKKLAADAEHEPDLYKISELFPVPDVYEDESIVLQCTLQGGPKARMPIYSGLLSGASNAFTNFHEKTQLAPDEAKKVAAASFTAPAMVQCTPRDQEALYSFSMALGGVVDPVKAAMPNFLLPATAATQTPPAINIANASPAAKGSSTLMAANQLAFGNNPFAAAAFQASSAQFAAGFAAAAAMSQQQFQHNLQNMFMSNFSAPAEKS